MASSKRKNYYAVAGVNGYGAYNNYEKVLESREYIKNYKCKGCKTWEEAKEMAFQLFHEIRGPIAVGQMLELIKSMN